MFRRKVLDINKIGRPVLCHVPRVCVLKSDFTFMYSSGYVWTDMNPNEIRLVTFSVDPNTEFSIKPFRRIGGRTDPLFAFTSHALSDVEII